MTDLEIIDSFAFPQEWRVWGLIGADDLRALAAKYREDDDPHPEHWRWRAFKSVLADRRPLTEEECRQLLRVGELDPDVGGAGISMQVEILLLPECPADLIEAATADQSSHRARVVAKQLSKTRA